jgi:deoxyinosine 3'endonuclease (endonuclease V)
VRQPGGDPFAAGLPRIVLRVLPFTEPASVAGSAGLSRGSPVAGRDRAPVHAPSLLICDGYGLAHPRRFGLACHLGVLLDLPAYGVAKTAFVGSSAPPGPARGDAADLVEAGEIVGRVVRTQSGVKPVYVSAGHRIGLDDCTGLTLRLSGRYRIPEPTRQADILSRSVLRSL